MKIISAAVSFGKEMVRKVLMITFLGKEVMKEWRVTKRFRKRYNWKVD
jgi:hypothetical protein